MKLTTLVPAALLTLSGAVFAQAANDDDAKAKAGDTKAAGYAAAATEAGSQPDFATADTDKDGLLSIAELQAAMPDVKITDENADGFVNQSEAESAIAGLAFETNGYTGGSSLVSEPEYGLIVSQLTEEGSAAPSRSGAAGDAVDSGETADDSTAADASQN